MKMKFNIYLALLIISSFLLMSFASADLGTYAFNQCLSIKTISNSSNVTLQTISYPNSTQIIVNAQMTKNNKNFNYTFCKTNVEGTYIYDYSDLEGNTYVNSFRIEKGFQIGLFNIDFSEPIYITILILSVIGIGILCFFRLFVFASTITIILGFAFLFSGINLLITILTIFAGVILAFRE